jgi:outer membrane protein OmpA-like peptidoglycan-associated protein
MERRAERCASENLRPGRNRKTLLRRLALSGFFGLSLGSIAHGNVIGADTQNFNPTQTGIDFVTVQSSQTLTPGLLNVGSFVDYAINALPNYVNSLTQDRERSRDRILSMDFHFAVGLMKNWEAGMSVTSVLSQEVEADVFKAAYKSTGLTDLRFSTKVRVLGDRSQGLGLVGTINLPMVENNPFLGDQNNPIYNIEIVADTTLGPFAVGANLGYRIRSPGRRLSNVPIAPLDDLWTGSVAASYIIPDWRSSLIAELYGSIPNSGTETQTDRELSSNEFLFVYKYFGLPRTALYAGIGTEVLHGTFTPDWRFFAGFNYLFGPFWGRPSQNEVRASVPLPVEPPSPPPAAPPVPAPAPPPPPPPEVRAPVIMTPNNTSAFNQAPRRGRERFIVQGVRFRTDSDQVPTVFRTYLSRLATYLMKEPQFEKLTILGHTDSQGSAEYNLNLSQRRAETVKLILVRAFNIPEDKIFTQGLGESMPIADNSTARGRAQNRRVEFEIER